MKRYDNIVKEFYKRILSAIVIISIVAVYLIYVQKKTDFSNRLSNIIKTSASQLLNEYSIETIEPGSRLSRIKLEKISGKLIDELHFIHITLFTSEKKMAISADKPGYRELHDELWKTGTLEKIEFPQFKRLSYRLHRYKGSVYLQILCPIFYGKKHAGYLGGVSEVDKDLIKDFEDDLLGTLITVIGTILVFSSVIFPIIRVSYNRIEENKKELIQTNIHTLMTLGDAIALRDSDTNDHNYRVTFYSLRLAEEMKLKKYDIRSVIKGALLHDIGKIGISDTILLKEGPLNYEEYETMKDHVILGAALIADSPWIENGLDIIRYHHEKFDGTGYIKGLAGSDIPVTARIFSIADVFDALTSKRPYKEPLGVNETIEIMEHDSGIHFDPEILKVFMKHAKKMYSEIHGLDTEVLKNKINRLIDKYFST